MVSPHKIKYQNIFSNELNILDLIMDVAIDEDNGETQTYLNRSAIESESHDGRYKNTVRYKYDEVFAPKFTFFKRDFEEFTAEEVRYLLKYLTSTDTTSLLEVYYDNSNAVSWAAIGGWTEINLQKIANNRTIAVTAVFSSIMPFALSDLYTVTKTISSATDNIITIEIDTDDNKSVYPRITIQEKGSVVRIPDGTTYDIYSDMVPNTAYYNGATYYWKSDMPALCTGATKPSYNWEEITISTAYTTSDEIESGKIYYYSVDKQYRWIDPYTFKSSITNPKLSTTSVRFRNTHTDFFNQSKVLEAVVVKNNNTTEKIVLDGANKIVSSNSARRIFGDNFSWNWLELYDGKNDIAIEGNCEVTLEWREVRKIGEY